MTKNRSKVYLLSLFALCALLGVEIIYLKSTHTLNQAQKEHRAMFVKLVSLPDLAISSETRSIRNRSLSDSFSIFNEGPEIRDFFPASFIYAPSTVLQNQPARILIEK